jgi:uncharacterized protein (DUF433 family)
MKPAIHDRGRGPEILGSRITVYDVLAETRAGRSLDQLAKEWRLSIEQIENAMKYIEVHREEVERELEKIQQRIERERIESQSRVAAILANKKPANPEIWERFQRAKVAREARHARDLDRHESPGANGTHPGGARE